MSEGRPSRAERQADTRRRLIDAARQVFAAKGFHGASVDDVAAAAGFTKGAVYSNFDSKEALFLAVVDDRVEQQFTAVEHIYTYAEDDEVFEDQLARHTEAQYRDNRDWYVLALEFLLYAVRERPDLQASIADLYRRTDERVAAMIAARHGEQGTHPAMDPQDLALIQSAVGEGMGLRALIDPGEFPPERIRGLFDRLFHRIEEVPASSPERTGDPEHR